MSKCTQLHRGCRCFHRLCLVLAVFPAALCAEDLSLEEIQSREDPPEDEHQTQVSSRTPKHRVQLCFCIFIIILTIYYLLKHLKFIYVYMNVCICRSHIHIYSVSYLSSVHNQFFFFKRSLKGKRNAFYRVRPIPSHRSSDGSDEAPLWI